ncbi:aldehyde dehydrogenase family protein, partial [Escherichia coli]|uniref:aldehyde dehydrogenase family protein n=2 Tax=Enterobacteriaceae TaxID=543 RepID=UPI00112053E2
MSHYEVGHWINGAVTRGTGERQQDIHNPATGAVQGTLRLGSTADLDAAVASATQAAKSWSQTPPLARARVLFKFLTLLQDRKEQLAEAIVREHGKTVPDALGEVARGIEVVEFATGMPQLLKGEYTEQIARGIDAW